VAERGRTDASVYGTQPQVLCTTRHESTPTPIHSRMTDASLSKRETFRSQVTDTPKGWLIALAAALLAFAAALVWQSQGWHGSPNPAPLRVMLAYWATFAGLWGVLTWGVIQFGSRWSDGKLGVGVALIVVGLAAAVRAVVLALADPVLSDDIWRYLHEGALLADGRNPYAKIPANIPPSESPLPSALKQVNHPKLGAVYQPFAEYFFACMTWLHHAVLAVLGNWAWPRAMTFRLGMTVVDLGIVAMLIGRLREADRSPWWAGLYALHPLAISEIAGSGHQDVLGVAALLGGLLLFERANRRWLFAAAGGVALALAVAVKPIAAPAALPAAWAMRRWPKGIAVTAISGATAMVVLYLPFILMPGGIETMIASVRQFADQWTFNGSMYPLIKGTVDPVGYDYWWRVNKWLTWFDGFLPGQPLTLLLAGAVEAVGRDLSRYLLAGAALLAMGLSLWRSWEKLFRPMVVYLLVMMLGTSTLHPWYLLWALPLLPLCFDGPLWLLSGTLMVAYIAMLHPQTNYAVPVWLKAVEFAPVYALLLVAWTTGFTVTRPRWLGPSINLPSTANALGKAES